MKKNTKIGLVVVAALAAMVSVGICAFRRTPYGHVVWPPRMAPTASDVPVFDVPIPNRSQLGSLFMRVRCESGDGRSIFITRGSQYVDLTETPNQWPVFRYDPTKRDLISVKPASWEAAGGPTSEAGLGTPSGRAWLEEVDGILKYRASGTLCDIDAEGAYALRPTYWPDGTLVSVLTTDGPKRPHMKLGFGGIGGGYYGQHYVEIFRLPEMERVGKATRIPFSTLKGTDPPCWSPDGKFVVYANWIGTKMCVIHVDQEGETP